MVVELYWSVGTPGRCESQKRSPDSRSTGKKVSVLTAAATALTRLCHAASAVERSATSSSTLTTQMT